MITFDCCFRRYFVWAESIKRQQRPHKLKWVVTHVACTETIYFPFDRTAQFCLWLYGMESCLVILRCSPSLKKKKTSFVEPEIEFQKFKWKMKVFFLYIYCGNACALQLNIPPICHYLVKSKRNYLSSGQLLVYRREQYKWWRVRKVAALYIPCCHDNSMKGSTRGFFPLFFMSYR